MRRAAIITACAVTSFASIAVAAAPAGAGARIASAPAVATPSTFTLNLLGVPLVVDVTTDPGGNLVDVALNPPAPPADMTASTVKPNKVVFVNTDGTMKLKVSAKHGGQQVTARAATLTDVSGPGSWAGDVFDTGEATTVHYTVGLLADGSPDVTIDSVDSTLANVIGAAEHRAADGEGHGASASVSVKFSNLGQTRSLRIDVGIHDHDGVGEAALRVSLSKVKGAQTAAGDAVGSHTFTGTLCDGSIATFDYEVDADGAVTVGVLPDGATVKAGEHGAMVRLSGGDRVQIVVKQENEALTVAAKLKLHCEAGVPTVNTPIEPPIDPSSDVTVPATGRSGTPHRGDDQNGNRASNANNANNANNGRHRNSSPQGNG